MAVTDAQIRAVLAANPNASDERILKALRNYGVSPERFTAVTGRTLGATPAPTPVYQPPAPTPVYQQPTPMPAPAPAPAPAPVQPPLDEEIRAVLAANPNASDERILRALENYGVSPERFTAVTGRTLNATPTPAPVITPQTTTPQASVSPANTAQTGPVTGPTDAEIRNLVQMSKERAGGDMNSAIGLLINAMRNVGITPERLSQVINVPVPTINQYISDYDNANVSPVVTQQTVTPTTAPASQALAGTQSPVTPQTPTTATTPLTGQSQTGYTDEQIRNAVLNRAAQQGIVTQEELQRAAQNYGVTDEQLARVFPQMQSVVSRATQEATQEAGLTPAIEALGRAAGTVEDVSRQGQQELINRLSAVEGRVGGIFDTAQGYQQTYRDVGQEAAQRQAALTGALGPDAQAQAFAEYQASPALDYLQRQSERALTRNAAALGGVGGGNVRQDLVKLTADLYGQDYANQFARLGEIAQRGYGAAGTSAQLGSAQAGTIAGLGQAGATTAAQMQDALSGRLGNILGSEAQYRLNTGQNISNVIGGAASGISGLQVGASDAYRNIYGNLTDAQRQTATNLAAQYGDAIANQYLAQANAYQNQGSALGGVSGQTYTPVPGMDIGGAITAGGQAYDLASTMFGGNNQSYANQLLSGNVPFGTGGTITGPLPAQPTYMMAPNPSQNINFGNGVTTSSLLKI